MKYKKEHRTRPRASFPYISLQTQEPRPSQEMPGDEKEGYVSKIGGLRLVKGHSVKMKQMIKILIL